MSSTLSWEEARDLLRRMREEQKRDGEMVVQLWEDVIMDAVDKLGDELWVVYEQVCIAALDCRRLDLSEGCIEALHAKFPRSLRVQRLHGLLLESVERYDKAEDIYKQILEDDPANLFAEKRRVAMLKSQNKIIDAIAKLNDYVKKYQTDFEAWMELSDLYIQEGDYDNASFCLEELIMSNPHNHLYHQKYADIRYTQGGQDNISMARSYYSQAAKLNPNNIRALFGLFLSASSLASAAKVSQERQSNTKYAIWAAKQINEKYDNLESREQVTESQILDTIKEMLKNLNK